jgi:tetratricopeptide (TPR) repeat protein
MKAMQSGNKNNEISLVTDKSSNEFKRYYFEIERMLNDSCKVMRDAVSSNNETKEKSMSANETALSHYYEGVDYLKKEDYAAAIPFFKKAVDTDPEFVFAWDNLGICYRRTGRLDEALAAYQAALRVDPSGKTALQNLPVVYLHQKKNEEAIAAYKKILQYYPEDPEAYYGIGVVYFENLKDDVNALQNMCKAYNLYIAQKSPYRTDAEKLVNMIYARMKNAGKEDDFWRILKENNIKSN